MLGIVGRWCFWHLYAQVVQQPYSFSQGLIGTFKVPDLVLELLDFLLVLGEFFGAGLFKCGPL